MSVFLQTEAIPEPIVEPGLPVSPNLLLRKCACGGPAGMNDDCPACSEKRLSVQRKVSRPGDALELEADRLAAQVMRSLGPTSRAQAKHSRAAVVPKSGSSDLGNVAIFRQACEPESPEPAAPAQNTPAQHSPGATAAGATTSGPASAGLIVEDNATQVAPGQMSKSQFLDELKASVCAAADAELAAAGRSAKGCPYIEKWIGHYRTKDSRYVERSLHKFAPEAAGITSARDYIPIVSNRIRRSVSVWASTGQITGVPEELAAEIPGGGLLGALSGLASGISSAVSSLAAGIGRSVSSIASGIGSAVASVGRLFFKARDGGATSADPAQIQSRLGAGQPLDTGVRVRMESSFGHSFSHVRIHNDAVAAELSADMNAKAFTLGGHVAFASGEYHPGTIAGDVLIAHELAHVVQQDGGSRLAGSLPKGEAVYGSLEEDADLSAAHAVASLWSGPKISAATNARSAAPRLKSGLSLQRCGGTGATVQCSDSQKKQIYTAAKLGVAWLDKAIGQIAKYTSNPNDPSAKAVGNAFSLHFKSTAAGVVQHVKGRLQHISSDLKKLDEFKVECHTEEADKACEHDAAYVPGSGRSIVFCPSYFGGDSDTNAEMVVHEMAHAQVGGTHITDRGYATDRILASLSQEERLTNAESYGLFVQQLGTGSVPPMEGSKDTQEDCPGDWWDNIQKSIAVAQRWNRDAQTRFEGVTPSSVSGWSQQMRGYLGGANQDSIDKAKKAFDEAAVKLSGPVDFECEPKGGGRCDKFETYWYSSLADFHICPSWANEPSEDERTVNLLAGLYGYFGAVDDNERRYGYARLARQFTRPKAGSLEGILGDPSWSPDSLAVFVSVDEPEEYSSSLYEESGTANYVMSDDQREYAAPPCQTEVLLLKGSVEFKVDRRDKPRPSPFTTPHLTKTFQFISNGNDSFTQTESDTRPFYIGPSVTLGTTFNRRFEFRFAHSGTLKMEFRLEDPDSGVTREYKDKISILPSNPCDAPPSGTTHLG